jgi:hypothetical protein
MTINKGDAKMIKIVSYIVKPSAKVSLIVYQPQGYVVSTIQIWTKISHRHDTIFFVLTETQSTYFAFIKKLGNCFILLREKFLVHSSQHRGHI